MALLIAVLRIVLPVLILFLLLRFILPRYRRYKARQQERIDVEATVVDSHPYDVSDTTDTSASEPEKDDTEVKPVDAWIYERPDTKE
jgi:hypothetical protein